MIILADICSEPICISVVPPMPVRISGLLSVSPSDQLPESVAASRSGSGEWNQADPLRPSPWDLSWQSSSRTSPSNNHLHVAASPPFKVAYQGWRLQSQFPHFPNFSASPKYMLAIEYHVHIWQVSPQLSCGDTCQLWMWRNESSKYFGIIKIFA